MPPNRVPQACLRLTPPPGEPAAPPARVHASPSRVETGRLTTLLEQLTRLPGGFHLHPKLERGLEARRKMARGERPLDWSAAEALALASLATEGVRIRLTGQDTARGTFSQRHAVLYDQQDGHPYVPLQHLSSGPGAGGNPQQPPFRSRRAGF